MKDVECVSMESEEDNHVDYSSETVTFAKKQFATSRKQFKYTIFATVLVSVLYTLLTPSSNLRLAFLIGDFLRFSITILGVFFLYRKGIPFAGRLFAIIWGLIGFTGLPDAYWADSVFSQANIIYLLPGLSAFLIGCLLDFSFRAKPQRRTQILMSSSIFQFLYIIFLVKVNTLAVFPYFSFVSALLLLSFSIFSYRKNLVSTFLESSVLCDATHQINIRFKGYLIAALLFSICALLFVNSFGASMQLDKVSDDATIRTPGPTGSKSWFWKKHGQFLTPALLNNSDIFFLYGSEYKDFSQNYFNTLSPNLALKSISEEYFSSSILYLKSWHKLLSLSTLENIGFLPTTASPHLILFESYERLASPSLYYSNNMISGELLPMTVNDAGVAKSKLQLMILPLVSLGLLGFIILLRGGGGNVLALLLGVLLIGTASSIGSSTQFFLPHIQYQTWVSALSSFPGGISYRILLLIQQVWQILLFLVQYHIPLAGVFACLLIKQESSESNSLFNKVSAFLINFALIMITIHFLRWLLRTIGNLFTPPDLLMLSDYTVLSNTISYLLSIAITIILLFRSRRRLPDSCFKVSELSMKILISISVLLIMSQTFTTLSDIDLINIPSGVLATIISVLIMMIILFLGLISILRLRELHILDSQGLSSLLLLAILPVFVEAFESVGALILTSTPFFISGGADILGIIVAVALLGPIDRKLASILNYFAIPNLKIIKNTINSSLEELADAETIYESRKIISSLLTGASIGVDNYAYYSRIHRGNLKLVIETLPGELPETLIISEGLWSVLSTYSSFIDGSELLYSWKFLFEKYEINRILLASKSQYLLPVTHGNSLMGILLLPKSTANTIVEMTPIAEMLGRVVVNVQHKS